MVAEPREFRHGLLPYLVSSKEEDVKKKNSIYTLRISLYTLLERWGVRIGCV